MSLSLVKPEKQIKITWPGLYQASVIPEYDYHADNVGSDVPTLNRGLAATICNASLLEAEYFHPRLGGHAREVGEQKQKNLDAGNVRHSMILGSGQAFELVPGFDDWKTKAARERRDGIRESGRIPLLEHEHDRQRRIVDAVLPRILSIVGRIPPEAEMTALWEELLDFEEGQPCGDQRFRARCRTRIDIPMLDFPGAEVPGTWNAVHLRPGAWVFDLKPAPAGFGSVERTSEALGYDIQAYMNVHSLEVLIPELAGRIGFAHIAFQVVPPYDVAVLPFSAEAMRKGRSRFERACKAWAGALASNQWPGVGGYTIEVKPWDMDREIAMGLEDEEGDGSGDE